VRRPSFQFYPADWRNNANLRRCSPAARGIWIDVMCVLHDSDEYGIVRWPLADLANAANAPIKLVRELVEKSVLKGDDKQVATAFVYIPRSGRKDGDPVTLVSIQAGPVWYSSRMVKDEYVRTIRGESTRFDASPKDAPKPPFGDGSTSSSSSTPTVNSVPIGTGSDAADGRRPKTPAERRKSELWGAIKAHLVDSGESKDLKAAGAIVTSAIKRFDEPTALAAIEATLHAKPASAIAYLQAACQQASGQRLNKQEELEAGNLAAA
jgi:hypothetical protein